MARIARQISQSGLYHIVFRGVNRQHIFEEEADYIKLDKWGRTFFVSFLSSTTGAGEETSVVKYAYDLSGNLITLTTGLASVTATGGKVTSYEYSPFGELLKETDPMNYEKSYTYE